jgi:hypothetical protein
LLDQGNPIGRPARRALASLCSRDGGERSPACLASDHDPVHDVAIAYPSYLNEKCPKQVDKHLSRKLGEDHTMDENHLRSLLDAAIHVDNHELVMLFHHFASENDTTTIIKALVRYHVEHAISAALADAEEIFEAGMRQHEAEHPDIVQAAQARRERNKTLIREADQREYDALDDATKKEIEDLHREAKEHLAAMRSILEKKY